jgi:hypothetical protein
MFAPLDGVPEDPATGSANAALAALLTHCKREQEGDFRLCLSTDSHHPGGPATPRNRRNPGHQSRGEGRDGLSQRSLHHIGASSSTAEIYMKIDPSEARIGDVIWREGHVGSYSGVQDSKGRYLAVDMGGRSPDFTRLLSNWGEGSSYGNNPPIEFFRPMVPTPEP